jgi:predicted small lipoprotein YifL
MRKARLFSCLALLLALALLGACGKKGGLTPPPGEPDTFPRTYPRE